MPKLSKLMKYIFDPDYRFLIASRFGKCRDLPDEEYIRKRFHAAFKYDLDLDNPKTFNEKLQWLKLNDRKDIYTTMVDKYAVKQYVAERIGEEHIIPTLGIWDKFEDIDFDSLPNQFVLKCTHDSGGLSICKDKKTYNFKKAKKKIEFSLKRNFYYVGREWPYKNVPKKIIAEKYMEDEANKGDLSDYKIHCFNGEPKVIQVIRDRFSKTGMVNDHYYPSWEKLDLRRGHHHSGDVVIPRPQEMDKILELAGKLSQGMPYLRVDFYIVNHQIYFGELTFFPANGFNPFNPEKWDRIFGDWIELPEKNI